MAAICPLPACQGRTFISDIALEQHMRSSRLQHPFCESCDRKFVNVPAFAQHLRAVHSPQYNCCGKTFLSNEALKRHRATASSHPECSWCDERFINEEERDNHEVARHRLVQCQDCRDCVVRLHELDDHYADSDEHARCSFCQRGLLDGEELIAHTREAHPNLLCAQCDEVFLSGELLQLHYKQEITKHPSCRVCGIGFKDHSKLCEHLVDVHWSLYDQTVHINRAINL